MSEISERLIEIRKDLNMNQASFAKLLRLSRSQVGNLETGKRELNQQTIHIICTECNINEEWLTTGKGPKYNQAVIDAIDLAESARGLSPADPDGDKKLEMFQIAASLLHQFKEISYSCENIQEFLGLLSYPSFADQLGYIISIYSDALHDPDKSMITLELYNVLFEQTFNLVKESKRLKACGRERTKSFASDYLTIYAEGYYKDILAEETDKTSSLGVLPVAGSAAAGSPLYDEGDSEEAVSVPPKYLDRNRYFIVKAKGNSMEPRIMDGDFVVVESNAKPEQNSLALVSINGATNDPEYAIKIVRFYSDEIELISYNKAYPPVRYTLSSVQCVQKIVHVISPD